MLRQTVSLKFGSFGHPGDQLTFCDVFKPRLNPGILTEVAKLPGRAVVIFKEQRVKALFRRSMRID